MREMDRRARTTFGIPELILMEHAGTAVAKEAQRLLTHRLPRQGPVLVLCGAGANGGDGFVAARHLDNWGVPLQVVLVGERQKLTGATRTNFMILKRLGLAVMEIRSRTAWHRWSLKHRPMALAIDALLGTGVAGQVREPIRSVIRWLNQQRCKVVSVDLPSGLSADTGVPCGVSVRATVTVACGLPQAGLSRAQGRSLSGRVTVADISLPRVARSREKTK